MKKTSVRQGAQSASCEPINEQEDLPKKIQGLLQREDKNPGQEREINEADFTRGYKLNEPCSDISISSQELEDSAWQQSSLGEYRQLSLWKSTPMLNSSSNTTSQESPSTQTSETTNPTQESLKSSQWDGRVREHQMQELERDSSIQPHLFGEKDLDALLKLNPSSVLWNSLKELSDEDLELFLPPSIWQDTLLKLKQSRQQAKALDNRGTDCLSFPTLTSNSNSTSRPAGQTKCDRWFKDNGLIAPGYQLSAQAMALIMGFPPNWFDCLSPTEHQEELEPDTSQDEQLHHHKQRSLSEESSTSTVLLGGDENLLEHKRCDPADVSSAKERAPRKRGERSSQDRELSIPCLVKQPKQAEVKGFIQKDLGDCPKGSGGANRFDVYIPDSDSTITVSKLFVYPDFSNSVGQIDKNPRKKSPPSKNNPRKTRRKKGQGNGTIYYRMVTKNGRQYQEAYYHYIENGKKRTKYIPKKLLDRVKEAESRKLPVTDILVLLVGKDKNPRKSSDTFQDGNFQDGDCIIAVRGAQSL